LRKEELSPKKVSAYVVQYYSAHLARAGGDPGALLALVSNGWRQAWEELEGSYSGFLNDVTQAWRAAERVNQAAIGAGHPAPYLGSEVRCALCHASINSLVGNIPANLLVTLVDEKKWPPGKGLAYARQMPGSWHKALALAGVARHLPEPLQGNVLREAWETARAMQYFPEEGWRRFRFDVFEPFEDLPQAWELEAQEAEYASQLALVEDLGEDWGEFASYRPEPQYSRARALASFASHLPESLKGEVLHEALEAARAIEEPHHRANALTAIVTHWPAPLQDGVLDEALAAVRALDQHTVRVTSWTTKLGQDWAESLQSLAQAAAEQYSQYYRAQALAALAQYLAEPMKGKILHEAMGLAQALTGILTSESEQVRTLWAEPGPYQFKSLVPRKALELAQTAEDQDLRYRRAKILTAIGPQLPEPQKGKVLQEALGLVRSLKDALDSESIEVTEWPSGVLFRPYRQLDRIWGLELEPFGAEALRYRRAMALAALGPHLPGPQKGEILNEAFEGARTLVAAPQREEILDELLEGAWALDVARLRAEVLTALAPYLPEPSLCEAFEWAWVLDVARLRAEVLTALAPYLPEPMKGDALDATWGLVRVLQDQDYRARTLTALGPYLPEPHKGEVLDEALQLARTLEKPQSRAEVLAELMPYLPEPVKGNVLHEVLGLVRVFQWPPLQGKVLTALAPYLPEQLLPEALTAVRAIENEWAPEKPNPHRALTLIALLAHLPEALKAEVLPEVLAATQALKDENPLTWSYVLVGLAPHLPEALKAKVLLEALAAARALVDPDRLEGQRAYVLTVLALRLSEPLKSEALSEAVAAARARTHNGGLWVRTLVGLALQLPASLKDEVLSEAVAAARAIHYRGFQAEMLARLVSSLPERVKREVLSEAVVAIRGTLGDRDQRARVLSWLAPQLAELPATSLYPLWRETLHLQATQGRRYLLLDHYELINVLVKLGGVEAVTETTRAVQDVGQWWP
jgi:hypothetical protein